jgi:hypothetical protein
MSYQLSAFSYQLRPPARCGCSAGGLAAGDFDGGNTGDETAGATWVRGFS